MDPVEANYQLLTRLSRITYSQDDVSVARSLLSDRHFDKGLFLASCFKQKVAGLVYFNIMRWGIWRMLPWVGFPLKFFYLANQERNNRLIGELKRILRAATRHTLDIRPLKGSILVPLVYSDGGSRLLIDLDFFVRRSDLTKASLTFKRLGYIQGMFDPQKKCILPLSRQQKLLWQLKMFEAPPFSKITGDEYVDYGNYFTLDLSFGIEFSEERDVSDLILAKKSMLGGIRTLSAIDFFIQLCGHLYKEASNELWVEIDLDINLIKFCDVREFALKMLKPHMFAALRERISELGAEKSVYFSLYLVYEIYQDRFFANMMEALPFHFQNLQFMTDIYRQGDKVVGVRKRSLVQSIGSL